jgi:hypothetical protein
MSQKPTPADLQDLERRYASGRDIEPDPGLDRIIQARAEQAIQPTRRHRPAPWLGGLATAAALVLAIGVVLQQGVFEGDRMPAPPADSTGSESRLDRLESAAAPEAPALRAPAPEVAAPASQRVLRRASEREAATGLATFSEPRVDESLSDGEEIEALRARAADMSEQELLDWLAELLEMGDLTRAGHLLHYLGERQAEAQQP